MAYRASGFYNINLDGSLACMVSAEEKAILENDPGDGRKLKYVEVAVADDVFLENKNARPESFNDLILYARLRQRKP
jgi:hypothetical protein